MVNFFYDKNNPLSHDSNHASIYEDADYGFAVNDIVNFYQSLDITPRSGWHSNAMDV